MCGGHHGWGSEPSCCCGCGGHSRQGGGCGCHPQGECGCGGHSRQGGGCGGGHRFRFHRWFSSGEEETAALEEYLKQLEAEAKGVRERLTQLRGA
jgi:hypothetical protein